MRALLHSKVRLPPFQAGSKRGVALNWSRDEERHAAAAAIRPGGYYRARQIVRPEGPIGVSPSMTVWRGADLNPLARDPGDRGGEFGRGQHPDSFY